MIEWGVLSVEKNEEFEAVLLETLKQMTDAGFMYCFNTDYKPTPGKRPMPKLPVEKLVLVVAKPVVKEGEDVRRVVRVPGGGIIPI